jgi:pimeloyl-ACP methyl ester carboxylesterase
MLGTLCMVAACSPQRARPASFITNQATQSLGEAPELRLADCRVAGVDEQLRCGTYYVAENRAKPSSKRIPLKFVLLPAKKPSPGSKPIFIFAGGPGEAATDYAPEIVASTIRDEHDVVLVDQRGTGEGHRLDCDFPETGDIQKYLEPLFADTSFWANCARKLGGFFDLTQYATPAAARDIDEVRKALGYDKINVMGGSYGSRVGIIYIKMFGGNVRSAFLSGLNPLELKSPLYHAAGGQRAFDLLVTDCKADDGCRSAFPDSKHDLDMVLQALTTKPAQVTVKHPTSGEPIRVNLTRDAFAEGLRAMLYSTNNARRIPLLLNRATKGDFTEVAQNRVNFGHAVRRGMRLGMGLSANCNEDTERITEAEVRAETAGTFLGPDLVLGKMAACAVWPDAELPDDHFTPFRSHVPVVLVSGQYDPVAPPRWGEVTRKYLPNSAHLVVPTGHSIPDSRCIDDLAHQLFKQASVKRLDTSCISGMHLPAFVHGEGFKRPQQEQ